MTDGIKWVDFDGLSSEVQTLTHFEPGEILQIKGLGFHVQGVSLDPPMIICVPIPIQSRTQQE